jgi:hypothetical protein
MKIASWAIMFALASAGNAYGWGQEGHSIVAELAQHRLTDASVSALQKLLGRNVSLASIASWADDYRAEHPETGGWHFVNIPDDRATYDPAVDCAKQNCAVDAITHFTAVLGDCAKTAEEQTEALKFIVHFVGDIHQPLHSTDRADPYTRKDDQGGNLVKVTFFGADTNLHAVWDTGLIMHTVYDWGAYVVRVESGWLRGRDLFAHSTAYDYPDDAILGLQYLNKSVPIVDRQLSLAGVRLAQLLNQTFQSTAACSWPCKAILHFPCPAAHKSRATATSPARQPFNRMLTQR